MKVQQQIIQKVAQQLNLSQKTVGTAYRCYWKYIRNTISAMPLKDDLTEKQFNELPTVFNIKYIGKIQCTY